MSSPRWLHMIGQTLKDNSPSILSGLAVAGVVGTAVLAVRATPRALEEIAEAKAQWVGSDDWTEEDKLPVIEQVKAGWKPYLPAGIVGTATIACIIASTKLGNRRNAAIFGAYTLVDKAFSEYKDKVVEQIGADKEQRVVDAVQKDRMERNPASSQVVITGMGDQLVYDAFSGRYFRSDVESIRKAANDINATVLRDMYVAHNEFYSLLGLEQISVGDTLGWNLDNLMELVFSSHLNDCGIACLAIDFKRLPKADYGKI